jgi:hypothetical protein
MIDDIADLVKDWPLPMRLLVAFLVTFVVPAPLFSVLAQMAQKMTNPVPFPMNVFVWIYGGGLQAWLIELARTIGTIAVMAAIAVPVAFAGIWLWWFYGPGAMQRRKRARQEVWLNAHAQQIQDKRMRQVYKKAAAASASGDREAFERENRRWD